MPSYETSAFGTFNIDYKCTLYDYFRESSLCPNAILQLRSNGACFTSHLIVQADVIMYKEQLRTPKCRCICEIITISS